MSACGTGQSEILGNIAALQQGNHDDIMTPLLYIVTPSQGLLASALGSAVIVWSVTDFEKVLEFKGHDSR